MNLILLTFGERLENHYQASFAILTFLKDPTIERVIVLTDRPEFYAFLGEKVEMMPIDNATLQQWQGEHQFFWRVKIKALEAVQQRYPQQNLLYVDSDTFLATDLSIFAQKLNSGQTFMHTKETVLADNCNNTLRKMYRTLNGKSFANIEINGQSAMWNAGVIGLPAEKAQACIELALQLCDEICATDCPRKLVEQFAFSLALNHIQPLQPCDQIIGHYWGNKSEWNQIIANFFVQAQLKQLNLDDCVQQLKDYDWNQLPLEKKQRNSNAKLRALVDKIFKAKNIRYFS